VTQGSSSSSSLESLSGGLSSVCAGLVCRRIAGRALEGQIAAGSYGRVYRGDYFGSKVSTLLCGTLFFSYSCTVVAPGLQLACCKPLVKGGGGRSDQCNQLRARVQGRSFWQQGNSNC
jgi:hypothetical protein